MSKFLDKYVLREELGRGAFSIVYRCTEISTNRDYAAKVIKKDKINKRDMLKLESEARICRKLNHPNVVKLHRVISEPKLHYFVFDLVTGGELFDDLVAHIESYTEELTARCMYQILDTIRYIHMMGVVHRDMKPENILLESKEKKNVKIADFGLAVEVSLEDENKWFGMAGTPNYMAPEVLEMKPYGRPIDIWACGVIMYIMLAGFQPFYHSDERRLHMLIKTGDYELTSDVWKSVTAEGKDLITKLMCVVPSRRLTAVQALEHPWFKKVKVSGKLHRQETLDRLKDFNAKRKFKAAVQSSIFLRQIFTDDDLAKKKNKGEDDSSSATSSSSSLSMPSAENVNNESENAKTKKSPGKSGK